MEQLLEKSLPVELKKPCKHDRKTLLQRQALARMGSFNSAPKINNSDSQDNDFVLPKELKTSIDVVNYCKEMRGIKPELLRRSFLRPDNQDENLNDLKLNFNSMQLNDSNSKESKLNGSSSSTPTSTTSLRLLQWNILSQSLGVHNDKFVCCPDDALTWDARKYLIVQEIVQNNPDLICLQEVDHFKFLQNILRTLNYEGIFFPKPDSPCLYFIQNNGPDGCAVFYKQNKLELLSYDTRILEVWQVQSNQVAIAANFRVIDTNDEFCVCTTHLKARSGALLAKLRNEQGKDILKFVQQVADGRAVIICGDFNAEPTEPVYSTMIDYEELVLSSAYADLAISGLENGRNEIKSVGEADENVRHERIEKSISNEPTYTTWKIRQEGEECHTIDYVFYTQDKLKVVNCLNFPCEHEIGKNRTPSHRYPSDHFSLMCDFQFDRNDRKSDSNQQ